MKVLQSMCRSIVVASLAVFLSGPAFASAGTPVNRPAATETATTTPAPAGNAGEAERYAARESSAKDLESFSGGYLYYEHHHGGVYIGGGVLVAALLVVLILVLI